MTYEQEYERDLLEFKMCMLQAEIKLQSMLAANKQAELDHRGMVYFEDHFTHLINEYGIHHNKFPTLKG